jgi:glycosyltransferase involved in cell wall biosynthesis
MPSKRIAILLTHPIQYFSPFFKELAAAPGIDLTVYYCSAEGHKEFRDAGFGRQVRWDIPLLEGYKSVFLPNYNPCGGINSGFFGLFNLGLPKELIRGHYDFLFVHGWSYFSAWLAFAAAVISRLPFVVRGESPLNQELCKSRWRRPIKKIIFGFIFRSMKSAMAIGSQNAQFYRYYGVSGDKIKLMPYAVDNARFMQEADLLGRQKEELRKKYGLPLDKVVINFTGKLSAKKRPLDLLAAYSAAQASNKALVFVGDGALAQDLRRFAEAKKLKDVYFMGFKNQSEISQLYALSDIFVLPSGIGETWGLVVNEAMCFSLPVVVSDMVGCAADLVKPGENGFIYPLGGIDKLTACLLELITDADLRARMGKRSFEIINKWSFKEDLEAVSAII